MSKNVARRGRPSKMTSRFVAEVLGKIENHEYFEVSYYHLDKMVQNGYLDRSDVKHEGRGRPSKSYIVSSKGRNLLRLSKNWFQKVAA